MPKKANKKRKKPSPAQAAQNKKQTPEARRAKKSKKPLIIAIAAVAAVCAVFIVLLLTGVLSPKGGLNGTWENAEFGYKLIIDGDTAVNEDGTFMKVETDGDLLSLIYENGERYEYAYVVENDTLAVFEASDESRQSPLVVFTRADGASLPESSSEPSSSEPSSSEPSSDGSGDEPDDGIPDFETLGIADDLMKTGVVYSLTTKDYTEDGVTIKGTLEVAGYEKTALTEKALTFAEDMGVDLTGYESRAVTVKVNFDSMTADVAYIAADYYNTKLFEDNFEPIGVSAGGTQYAKSKIKYNGAEYAVYMLGDTGYYEDETVYKSTDVWEAIVPEGYDGVCFGYYNTQLLDSIPDGVSNAYSYDYYKKGDMYYFRCA